MEEEPTKIVLRLNKSIWNKKLTVQTSGLEHGDEPLLSPLGHGGMPSSYTPRKRALSNSSMGTGIPDRILTLDELSLPSEVAIKRMKDLKSRLSPETLHSIPTSSSVNGCSLLSSMAITDTISHCVSLHTETSQKLLMPLVQKLMQHQRNESLYNHPVDAIALGIPEYLKKIKQPMDLGTVKGILLSGDFSSFVEICDLIKLVFDNAMTFNHRSSQVYKNAAALKAEFETDLAVVLEKQSKEVTFK